MDRKKKITVNIINRNYPPFSGITGESASELADFLSRQSIQINVIHVDADYSGNPDLGRSHGTAHRIATFYNGKNKMLRLLSSLYEGFRLVARSNSIPSDVTICMTDPPLLNMWAARLLPSKKKYMLWTMDLYPEGFVSGKLTGKGRLLYKIIDRAVLKRIPDHVIALGPHQAKYLQNKYKLPFTQSILPCGIYATSQAPGQQLPPWAADRSKIYLGYCGNLGEAHSLDFVKHALNAFEPEKHVFILSTYGGKAAAILEYAKMLKKPGLVILPSVSRKDLKLIDVHLASLNEEWINVSVPSKTVSSVCAGSTFVYYGSKASDNWELLGEAGWIIEAERGPETIKEIIANLDREKIDEKRQAAVAVASRLHAMKEQAFSDIHRRILELSA
jgi:hypothetical protein